MQFVNILMLFGLLAVAVPVIIQLLNRKNASRISWGAWMFIDASMKRRRRRVLLEDILLLGCRCLIPALLALAFARPFVQPDSPVPWGVVMPVLLLSITMFGVSFALWRYPKWRRGMMFGGIALFALAVAAIVFERQLNLKRFGLGATKDIALVVDGSASMSMLHEGKSNFERGLAEARKYIEQAPRGTAFAIILGGPVPQVMNPVPIADRRVLFNTLEQLRPANGTMQIVGTLTAAAVTLASGHNAVKQIVIVGDGQTVGWSLDAPERWRTVQRVFAQLRTRPVVVWRTLPLPTSVRNLAISEVRPSRDVVGTDREVGLRVTVVNAGTEAVTPNGVDVTIGRETKKALDLRQLAPGESQTFNFNYRFAEPGAALVTAHVDCGDDLPADDTFQFVLPVAKSLKVLIVDGEPAADVFRRGSTFISLALRPELSRLVEATAAAVKDPAASGPGFLLDTVVEDAVQTARRTSFSDFAAVVLVDVPRLPQEVLDALAIYCSNGGGVLFLPGARADKTLYNGWKFKGEPVLPLSLGAWTVSPVVADSGDKDKDAEEKKDKKSAAPHIDTETFTGDALRELRTGSDLGTVEPLQYWKLDEGVAGGQFVVARLSTGVPFLAIRSLSRGAFAIAAFPFDAASSSLVAKRGFVPFVHQLVYYLARPVSVRLDIPPSDGIVLVLAPSAASGAQAGSPGLVGYYYPQLRLGGRPIMRTDPKISFNWGGGAPFESGFPSDNFSVRWMGAIVPPQTGDYTFWADADDRFSFKIGGKEGKVFRLKAGEQYPFTAVYEEDGGIAAVWFKWRRPDGRDEVVPESAFLSQVAGGEGAGSVVEIKDPHGESFYGEIFGSSVGLSLRITRSLVPGLYHVIVPEFLRLPLAGVIDHEGQIPFSVVSGVEESTMSAITADQTSWLRKFIQISTATKEEDVEKAIQGQSFGKEVWRLLALAAFLFIIAEVALTRWISIQRRTGEDISVEFKNDKLQASEAFKRSLAKLGKKD